MARLAWNAMAPRRIVLSTLLLLVVGAAGVADSLLRRSDLLAQLESQQAASARLERRLAHEARPVKVSPADGAALQEMAEVAGVLGAPWERMLDDLQRAATPAILLAQVQPGEKGRVTVSGRADSPEAFTDYVARLRATRGWREVVPVSEATGTPDITGKAVAFQLQAEYGPHD